MSESSPERKLAAIVAADVVGYSRLMSMDEAGTHARLKALREQVVEPQIAQYHGRIVKLMGDGILAEFPSVVDALACAVEVQRAVVARNADLAEDQQITFRIGINLGDVIVDGDDIYGDGVNIAARLEALAEPGGIYLSGMAYDHVRNKLGIGIEPLGEQTVKNIAEPVRVYRVVLDAEAEDRPLPAGPPRINRRWRLTARRRWMLIAIVLVLLLGGGLWRYLHEPIPLAVDAAKTSVIVLPFANMSNESDQEYFADGIAEDLITELSRISSLLVVSRSAAFRYKGQAVDPERLRRELGVGYVLEGSVRKAGERVRVSAQLIDADTGYHLWAERYDRALENIFDVQDEITSQIVRALQLKLSNNEEQLIGRRHTENAEAYDLLLRARATYVRWTSGTNRQTIELLERALELDPAFAAADADLARAYFQKWFLGGSMEPALLDRALEYAQAAIAKDPRFPEAYSQLGWMYLWKKEHDKAIAAMQQAIEIDPINADAMSRLSETLMFAGRPAEALDYIQKARQYVYEEPYWYGFWAGEALFYLNRHEGAIRELELAIALNPRFFGAMRFLAAAYAEIGQLEKAKKYMAETLRLNPRLSETTLRRQQPFRNPADLERLIEALRLAGLPE